MSRPQYATVRPSLAGDDVEIVALHEERDEARCMCRGELIVLSIYYRRGTFAPRVGDRLGTWREASQRWVMAPW